MNQKEIQLKLISNPWILKILVNLIKLNIIIIGYYFKEFKELEQNNLLIIIDYKSWTINNTWRQVYNLLTLHKLENLVKLEHNLNHHKGKCLFLIKMKVH